MASVDDQEFEPPDGTFLVLLEDGATVAGGAIRRLSADTCEVKRMWTAPGHRRKGYASVVLDGLEDVARDRGYSYLRLETGPAQPEARSMYESRGYRRIPNYGRYEQATAFEHQLDEEVPRSASASLEIAADADRIFELIADPAKQPRWGGNDNLAEAADGQRVRAVGEVFTMTITRGRIRENHVVEFQEGRRIGWRPAEPGQDPPGHLWLWELEPIDSSRTRVTHTYDWTQLADERRFPRARATTADKLQISLDRLAALAEGQ
jgi:uncharacterized protein YndB with AHSA1/START domain